MSKHWRPDGKIVQRPWGPAESYVPRVRRQRPRGRTDFRMPLALLAGAVAAGLLGGFVWQRSTAPALAPAFDSSAIEWNAVQAVPRRTPDASEIEWEQRSRDLDSGAVETGTADGASNQAVRASFAYCKWGGGTNCVVDGDTFYIGGEKVRIAGIDAPETHPSRCDYEARLGNEATERLHDLLNSGTVTMTSIDRDRDRYGRLLRNVAVGGQDVGEAMIAAGVAREYGHGRRP